MCSLRPALRIDPGTATIALAGERLAFAAHWPTALRLRLCRLRAWAKDLGTAHPTLGRLFGAPDVVATSIASSAESTEDSLRRSWYSDMTFSDVQPRTQVPCSGGCQRCQIRGSLSERKKRSTELKGVEAPVSLWVRILGHYPGIWRRKKKNMWRRSLKSEHHPSSSALLWLYRCQDPGPSRRTVASSRSAPSRTWQRSQCKSWLPASHLPRSLRPATPMPEHRLRVWQKGCGSAAAQRSQALPRVRICRLRLQSRTLGPSVPASRESRPSQPSHPTPDAQTCRETGAYFRALMNPTRVASSRRLQGHQRIAQLLRIVLGTATSAACPPPLPPPGLWFFASSAARAALAMPAAVDALHSLSLWSASAGRTLLLQTCQTSGHRTKQEEQPMLESARTGHPDRILWPATRQVRTSASCQLSALPTPSGDAHTSGVNIKKAREHSSTLSPRPRLSVTEAWSEKVLQAQAVVLLERTGV